MKQKPDTYNEQLDELAQTAMACILNGAFSHPIILTDLDKSAKDKGKSLAQEIAFLSYEQATMMMQTRKTYLKSGIDDKSNR